MCIDIHPQTASDNRLKLWSTTTGKCVQSIPNIIHGPATDIVWAKDKRDKAAILFSCADGMVHVYV